MSNSYELTEAAENDLSNTFDFTSGEFGFDQAVKYLVEIEEKLDLLTEQPQIGRARNEVRAELRSTVCQSHVIFYRIVNDKVRVLRVLHGSRDIYSPEVEY